MTNSTVPQWIKLSHFAFKLWIEQQPFPKVLLGFDVGLRSTGVSVTSSDLKHAFLLTTVKGNLTTKPFRQQVTNLILKEKPVGLVIGKPNYVVQARHSENIIQGIDEWIKQMAYEHPKTSQMRFTFIDESWTTLSAKSQLKAIESQIRYWGHLRKQKELVDGMAAINILRNYLSFYNKN